jgi:hypothetical protein
VTFLPTGTQLCFFSHPTHLTSLWRHFLISQSEVHFERTTITDDSRDYTENSQLELCAILKKVYQDCFQKWQWHWKQCINAGGEHSEGDKAHSVAGMTKKYKNIVP